MAKNFFKTFFNSNKDKSILTKNLKLSPNHKLSEIVVSTKNSEDTKILQSQQQPIDSYNVLLNYYTKKDEHNNIINNFMEKINKLNKKFYSSSEKFVITRTSFDKLSDELFLNLFKQIDCYVEEIQRLNKKISSIDSKDNKLIIKNLNKELSENKEKIRNYEIKLKEKTTNEEKLNKELESYKRRIIFFKNKININLMARNTRGRNRIHIHKNENETNKNSNNYLRSSNFTRSKGANRDKSSKNFFSPSPRKSAHLKTQSSYNSNFILKNPGKLKKKVDSNLNNNNIANNTISNFKNIKNIKIDDNSQSLVTDNAEKSRGIFSDGEVEDNSEKLINITRSQKPKESIIIPYNKNYNQDDEDNNLELIYESNDKDNNKENKKLTAKEALVIHLKNCYSPDKNKINDKSFEANNESSFVSEKEDNKKEKEKEPKSSKIDKKFEKKILDTKSKRKKVTISINNSNANLNKKNKNWKMNTTAKKSTTSKKIFNFPSKKFTKSSKIVNKNSKNQNSPTKFNLTENNNKNLINEDKKLFNTINNESNTNTLEDIKATNIENLEIEDKEEKYQDFRQRSKTVRFKQEDTIEKDQKYQFTTSESENCDISSKDLPDFTKKNENKTTNNSGNISDILSKSGTNNDYLSIENNSNLAMKKNKKINILKMDSKIYDFNLKQLNDFEFLLEEKIIKEIIELKNNFLKEIDKYYNKRLDEIKIKINNCYSDIKQESIDEIKNSVNELQNKIKEFPKRLNNIMMDNFNPPKINSFDNGNGNYKHIFNIEEENFSKDNDFSQKFIKSYEKYADNKTFNKNTHIEEAINIKCTNCPNNNISVCFCEYCKRFFCQFCVDSALEEDKEKSQHNIVFFDELINKKEQFLKSFNTLFIIIIVYINNIFENKSSNSLENLSNSDPNAINDIKSYYSYPYIEDMKNNKSIIKFFQELIENNDKIVEDNTLDFSLLNVETKFLIIEFLKKIKYITLQEKNKEIEDIYDFQNDVDNSKSDIKIDNEIIDEIFNSNEDQIDDDKNDRNDKNKNYYINFLVYQNKFINQDNINNIIDKIENIEEFKNKKKVFVSYNNNNYFINTFIKTNDFSKLSLIQIKKYYPNFVKLYDFKFLYEILSAIVDGKEYFDCNGNTISPNSSFNFFRGTEKYDPPYGWFGIGLKVNDKNENNNWLENKSKNSKWAIAYLNIGKCSSYNNFEAILCDVIVNKKIDNETNKKYKKKNDKRHKGEKVGEGVILFPFIKDAERNANIFTIYEKKYKILLMAKVRIDKIREPPKDNIWILNKEFIRIYRILLKET